MICTCLFCIFVRMTTKLTLKINKKVIESAKVYASENKTSLSRMVESYFQSLTSPETKDDLVISPFVESITADLSIPLDLDYKKVYREQAEEKHR